MARPHLAALALTLAPLAGADVLTVGPASRNADHAQIQAAVDAASDGDVIWVFPNADPLYRYDGFVVDGKSITIRGEGRPYLLTGPVTIRSIPVGKSVRLDGLDMNLRSFPFHEYWSWAYGHSPGLTISDCAGAVRLIDCSAEGNVITRSFAGLQLFDALDVACFDCTFHGGLGDDQAPAAAGGVQSVASRFALFHCEVFGGDGGTGPYFHGGHGGPGIALFARSVAWLVDTRSSGGTGESFFCSGCPDPPGDGGHGIDVQAGSIAIASDCVFEGGPGSIANGTFEVDGVPGVPIVGSVAQQPGTTVPFDSDRAVRSGAALSVRVEGTPGDVASVALARGGGFRFLSPTRGALLVSDFVGAGFIDLGPIPSSGRLEASVPVPTVAASSAEAFLVQASVRDSSGHFRLSGAHVVSVVGSDLDEADFDRRIIHVDAAAPGGGDGRTWPTAFRTLAEAAEHLPWDPYDDRVDVWVTHGTYFPSEVALGPGAHVLGGFTGNETSADQADPISNPTTLSGDPDGDGFSTSTSNHTMPFRAGDPLWGMRADGVEVSGFRVMRYVSSGVSLVGDATVRDCRFINNRGDATVDHRAGDLVVERCEFRPNRFTDALAVRASAWNGESVTIRECAMLGNQLSAVGTFWPNSGFPWPNIGTLNIEGCTFACETGRMVFAARAETVNVRNCIFRQTGQDDLEGPVFAGASTDVRYDFCCIDVLNSNVTGTGNVFTDPLFANLAGGDGLVGTIDDEIELSPNSPCIDAGNTRLVAPGVSVDLVGRPRFVDDPNVVDTGVTANGVPVVDIGALERQ